MGFSLHNGARRSSFRIVILVAALACAAPLAWASGSTLFRAGTPSPITSPADFRAFYCAARIVGQGRDPYRTEPLRSCEQAAARAFGLRMFDGLVLPAPLPPYGLLLLAPLGRLDFKVASPVWLGLCLAAFGTSCLLLAQLVKRPVAVTSLALLGPLAYVSLPLGQLMPAIVALLCAAALALRDRRFSVAAALCALTTLEPHVGLPACLGLFTFCARSRRALLCCGALALAVSLWWGSPQLLWEYARVIPLHALSQATAFAVQYSLTALLTAYGIGTSQALFAGTISYVVLTALGILVAGRLARRFGDDAFLILVPPAFAMLGGTFVHLAQIAVAVPPVLLLLRYLPGPEKARVLAIAAALALAIPWSSLADAPPLAAMIWRHPVPARPVALSTPPASELAEQTEAAFDRGGGYGSNGGPLAVVLALKLPTWFGLACFVTLAIRSARFRRRDPMRRVSLAPIARRVA